ncbi:MAG: ATP-dependent DNA ligase [Bacteroidota bacterium]
MRHFAKLFSRLDSTTKTLVKVAALVDYLEEASDEAKLWAVALLTHKRPRRPVNTRLLREWAADLAEVPLWLFEESYHVVGDLAETISLVLPPPVEVSDHPLDYWIDYLESIRDLEEEEKREMIVAAWQQLGQAERFVFNKLITGGWRIGVSQKLMVRALAKYADKDENVIAHRLMGKWTPRETTFTELILSEEENEDRSRPYPFYLAYALEDAPDSLGPVEEWQAERKWDGIRGQVIVRQGELFVWSRGEELVTDKFPEYAPFAEALPDGTVIDGEILAWDGEKPLPFNVLQTRIGRKKVGKKTLQTAPVALMAYDLIEADGEDLRERPLQERRARLEEIVAVVAHPRLQISPIVPAASWEDLAEAREVSRVHYSEGLMLKRKDSTYKVGRKRGDWWKWKVDPLTIDAVLIYAMRGHGRRANLYTDYTFAVWDGEALVPFTKAYSGLTDAEIRKVDRYVKKNTIERFGPVRSVTPQLVMEIAFEGISKSTRHKSGVALRFPRIARWREDKPAAEANTLLDLLGMLEAYG